MAGEACRLLRGERPPVRRLAYGEMERKRADNVWPAGPGCGGILKILVQPVDGRAFSAVQTARAAGQVVAPLTRLADGTIAVMASNGHVGAGQWHPADSLCQTARKLLACGCSALVGEGRCSRVRVYAPPRLLVIGAVPIAHVLAPMARLAGLDCGGRLASRDPGQALGGCAHRRRGPRA